MDKDYAAIFGEVAAVLDRREPVEMTALAEAMRQHARQEREFERLAAEAKARHEPDALSRAIEHYSAMDGPPRPRHIYLCMTEADEPDSMAMAEQADLVLLVRPSGKVVAWKVHGGVTVIDVSMPERDWSYSLIAQAE